MYLAHHCLFDPARRLLRHSLVVWLLALFAFAPLAAQAQRREALVFGANEYAALRPLKNGVNDALAMQTVLRGLGFRVTPVLDGDLRQMRRALANFAEDAAGADLALIFFAGHAVEIDGRNMLLPGDSRIDDRAALIDSALPLDEIADVLARSAKVGLVLLDACRDDPFGALGDAGESGDNGRGAVALGTADVRPGLGRIGRIDGLVVGFSAAPGATASDGSGANSPFTEALLRHLATPGVELRSALTLVQQDVYDRSRARQLPYVEAALPVQVYLAPDNADLPERARLLLAMAGLTDVVRAEVEAVAQEAGVPLAPLYAVLLAGGGGPEVYADRGRLEQAATEFLRARRQLDQLSPVDPEAQRLQQAAREALELGELEQARLFIERAIEIDATAGDAAIEIVLARRLAEAEGLLTRADIVYLTSIGGESEFGPVEYIAAFAEAARAFRRADLLHQAEGREMGLASLKSYETALERWQGLAAWLLTHGAPPDRDAMLEGVSLWLDVLERMWRAGDPDAELLDRLAWGAGGMSEAVGGHFGPWRWMAVEAADGSLDFVETDRGLYAIGPVMALTLGIAAFQERLLREARSGRIDLTGHYRDIAHELAWGLSHSYEFLAALHDERAEPEEAAQARVKAEQYRP
jgi:uncharacterized caspase-like protein